MARPFSQSVFLLEGILVTKKLSNQRLSYNYRSNLYSNLLLSFSIFQFLGIFMLSEKYVLLNHELAK